jgi:hypothetical protein
VPKSSDSLDVVRASATCAYARFKGVLLVNWRRQVLLDDVKAVTLCRDQMLKQDFCGAIHLLEAGIPLPDDECRRWARRGIEARANHNPVIAVVIFGDGFGASAVRSVCTALFAMRAGPPMRVFAQPTDAAGWLAEETDRRLDVAELIGACQELRSIGVR